MLMNYDPIHNTLFDRIVSDLYSLKMLCHFSIFEFVPYANILSIRSYVVHCALKIYSLFNLNCFYIPPAHQRIAFICS